MGKSSRIGIGFDLEKAIETLHREAMAAGAVPSAKSPDGVAPEISAQAHLHGVGPPRCTNSPCRLAGLCLALTELVQYRAEVKGLKPLLDALALTEEANIWLAKSGYEYAKALNAWIEHSKERHEWERARGLRMPMHDHEKLCIKPRLILARMTAFLQSLEGVDVRDFFQSPELRQSGTSKRSMLLLTAVWQHLDWGGLTHEEIYELVPRLTQTANAKDLVRERIREPDARSLFPRELHPELKGPPVDKRRRRRASKRASKTGTRAS